MDTRRYVVLLFRDRAGRVLLRKRDNPASPDIWGFLEEEMKGGETVKHALKRLISRMPGIGARSPMLFGRYEFRARSGLLEKFLFMSTMRGGLKGFRNRADGLGLFSFEQLKELNIQKGDMIILKDLFNQTEKVGMLYARRFK